MSRNAIRAFLWLGIIGCGIASFVCIQNAREARSLLRASESSIDGLPNQFLMRAASGNPDSPLTQKAKNMLGIPEGMNPAAYQEALRDEKNSAFGGAVAAIIILFVLMYSLSKIAPEDI